MTGVPPTVTSFTTRLEMNWAELAAVDVVMVRSSSVTVFTGSLADAPTMDQIPSQSFTVQSTRLMSFRSGGKSPVWPS